MNINDVARYTLSRKKLRSGEHIYVGPSILAHCLQVLVGGHTYIAIRYI
jgi:hypothetical protein